MVKKIKNSLYLFPWSSGLISWFFFLFSFFFLLSYPFPSFSQVWVDKMQDPTANFYDVQQSFNQYWQGKTIEKGKGWKQFKRWEWFMEPRVYPTGDRTVLLNAAANYKAYHDSIQLQKAPVAGNWTFLGPGTVPTAGGGAGRVNCIRFDPTNSNNIWIGTPAGGLWKSTNGGTSWTTNTDQLTVLGVSDVAIDPTNTNIMYIATGDGDASDTYSIGVLKSTDGGATWNTTGLTWTVNQIRTISRLLINPNNTSIILAATSNGVYRSADAGATWAQTLTGSRKDMEFKPGDPNTVYACGTTFYKSTNGGTSFTQVTSGIPTGVNRLAIAVTAADPSYVYVLGGNSSDSGFRGLYRSTDSGTSFTTRSTTPNVLGWDCGGTDSGGQSWYDLSIASSPTNRDVVIVGGVNIWRSTTGGTSWSMNAHWYGGCSVDYVHADQHDLIFLPGSGTTYFAGCDGGIFKTTNSGTNWSDLSSNLQIAQMYRLGLSATNVNLALSGWQDNGTNRFNPSWTQVLGGDGMECIVDYSNANIMYGELYYGDIYRSTNGGGSFPTNIVQSGGTGVNSDGDWVTPYIIHPTTNTTLLVGKSQVYRSTNSGTNWSQVGTVSGGTGDIIALAYAPSNGNYIYAAKEDKLYVSTNGTSFTDRTTGLPVTSANITYIAVSNTDPAKAWVTFSGYSSGNKVFYTANAGVNWSNYSTGLPNLPANCIVYQNGTTDGLYVGMDVGIYYRDASYTSWQSFNTGLPNVVIDELEIHYGSGKIRAATFGRGMWESSLFTAGNSPPIADFTGTPSSGCTGTAVQFSDQSSLIPTSWQWTFTGGTPSTSALQNPTVTYSATGNYDVTLIACNANGCDTILKTQYISITGVQALPLIEGFQSLPFLPNNWVMYNPDNDNTWQRSASTGGYGTSTNCAYYNNYSVDVTGTRDAMYTPKYDFSGLTNATLTFDVAYARWNATYSDTLAVFISTDCGVTFSQIYLKGGTTLATAPDDSISNFIPTNSQWRTETVNLNSYLGQPDVMLAFENRSWYGQYLFVDNINITGTGGAAPVAAFTSSSLSVCAGNSLTFTDQSTGNPTSWNWTFGGGTPSTSTLQNPTITFNTPGTYTITLTVANGNGSDSETKTNYISVYAVPTVSVAPSPATICEGSSTSLTASGASTYSWSPAGGLSATTGATVTANPSSTTTYTVTGTQNGCNGTQTVTVTVNTLPIVSVTPSSSSICEGSGTSLTASGATSYSWSPASGLSSTTGATVTANPTSTTTYVVLGTQNNCSDTQSVIVNVTPSPIVSVNPASPGICNGNNTTLTASGATSYSWSPATGLSGTTGATVTAAPSSTTTYIVTGTQNSCNDTQSVTVTVNAIPTVSVTPANPTICSGSSATLTASGATTYTWSPSSGLSATTGASVTANPSSTTTYTVTGTTGGCSGTQTITVTVTLSPTVSITPASPVICEGNTTTLTATGASTYSWSPASGLSATTGSSVDAAPASTTTYTVTGTQSGCNGIQNVTVTVNSIPLVTINPSSPTICEGGSTPLTASGASSYSWSPAAGLSSTSGTTVTANPSSTSTYTVTGTTNGCTGSQTVTVNVSPSPIVSVTPSSATICSGDNTSLTANGGSTYSWSPATGLSATTGSTVTANPSTTTTYTVTGTQSGCSGSQNVTVDVTPLPAITITPASPSICNGGSTTLTASGASSYNWSPATGLSGTSGSIVDASPASTTTYTVTGTQSGCNGNQNVTVTVNSIPVITINPASPTICEGSSAILNASGGTTYLWSPSSGLSDTVGASVTASPTATTIYSVSGTTNGCTSNQNVTVNVTPLPIIVVNPSAPTICLGNSIMLVASGASSYSWTPSGSLSSSSGDTVTASPLITTTYTVTGTSAGCTDSTEVTVSVSTSPNVSVSPATTGICGGDSTLLIASGATSYSWAPAIGLSATTGDSVYAAPSSTQTYTVTGSTGGCLSTNSANSTVNVNSPPVVSVSPSSPSICSNESVTLTATGASNFNWSPSSGLSSTSGTSVTANPSSTTTYTATETESGCNSSTSVTVNVTTAPIINVSASSDSICTGDSTILSASGATTYTWSPAGDLSSGSGDIVTATPPSDATYTVVGAQGSCTDTSIISITVNSPPTVSVSTSSDTICAGDSATLNASGATSYNWSPASGLSSITGQTVNASPSSDATYSVTGSQNGCISSNVATVNITVITPLTISISPINPSLCGGDSVSLSASGASSFTWSPPQGLNSTNGATVIASPTSTTIYSVTETESGCNGNSAVTVTVENKPIINVSASNSTICQGDSTLLSATGATNYTWFPSGDLSSSSGDSVSATPSADATYTVIGSEGNCSDSATISIVVNSPPAITVIASTDTICAGDSATFTASGASTYNWSPASGLSATTGQTVNASPSSNTTYFITGTLNGCTSTNPVSIAVNVNTPPVISVSPLSPFVCAGDSVTLTASGATGFTWSPSTGLNSTNGAMVVSSPPSTTSYTVTETESGCNGNITITVIVTNPPNLNISSSSNSICMGDSAILTVMGATTYLWSPSSELSSDTGNNVTATPSSNTTYTVVGIQGTCSDSATIAITVDSLPTVSVSASSSTICSGDSAIMTASGATTYNWSPSTDLNATTGSSVIASPSSDITYSVTGTKNGCTSNPATINVTVVQELAVSVSPVNPTICPGYPVTLTATGANDFSWSPAGTLDTSAGNNVIAAPASTTTYIVTETESGCGGNVSVTITVNNTLNVTATTNADTICMGDSVLLSAGGAATFTWTPSGSLNDSTLSNVVATPSSSTNYYAIGSSGNCSDTAIVSIFVNPLPDITINASTTTICPGNSSILFAGGASIYFWSPSSELNSGSGQTVVATPSATTIFTITGTNTNGCSNTNNITVTVNPAPVITVIPSSVFICPEDSALLTATGNATSYSWLPSEGLSSASELIIYASPDSSTFYTVTGTDDNGCTNSATVAVSLYPFMNSSTVKVDASCDSKDGKAIALVTGGTSPFTYIWNDSTSQTNAIAQGLPPGFYFVTITDANGCKIVDSSVVNLSSAMTLDVSTTGAVCGNNDGKALVIASGGPLPYSYLWSDSTTIDSISGVAAGNYSVTVSDFAGCVKIITVTVGTKPPVISKYIINESCDGKSDGAVAVTVSGGASPYSYHWNTEEISEDISGLKKGNYYLTVSDSIGCMVNDSAIVELIAQKCLSIPTGFTPNGDGKNDTWKIKGLEEFPGITIEIFNRWGIKVFSSKGYNEPWDGGGLPSAAYYYIIEFGDGTTSNGTVTIVR